jgi:prepilin-type N-terminal cleavage/methylation domain-containing protein
MLSPKRGGFTLVEMALVSAIILLFTAISIPVYHYLRSETRKVTCQNGQRMVRQAVDQWALANRIGIGQPTKPSGIVDYFRDAIFPVCPEGGGPIILPAHVGEAVCCPNHIASHAISSN